MNVTHTPADMVVLSLRIWLQMPNSLQQIWLCYPCGYGLEYHTYSRRYGYVIINDMALNATHIQADMVVLFLKDNGCEFHTYSRRYGCVITENMAANATQTPVDMVVLSLRIWLQMPHIRHRYGCVIIENMAVNGTNTQADMVVL